jgi:hypothetical protein
LTSSIWEPRIATEQLAATSVRSNIVELHFLGKVTDGGNSPALFSTSEIMYGREIYVVQGWKITDPQTLASLRIPDDEAVIAVPKELMRFLPEESHGAAD